MGPKSGIKKSSMFDNYSGVRYKKEGFARENKRKNASAGIDGFANAIRRQSFRTRVMSFSQR